VDPRRIDPATRIALALLSGLFNWRDALVVVQPKTLIRWHRAGFRLLWHWKSKPGRPPIPAELRRLIREMSRDNSLWGEERIANELLVKLGIRVSPRTVRKYMRRKPGREPRGDQRWRTFLRNHAAAIVACDFCVAVTASFRVLYIFVIIEHASRRLLHWNVTSNPTAAWTLQANSLCERLIGSLRRECLDWAIPLSEGHLRSLLKMWSTYYNRGRPHMALGPGVPDPPRGVPAPLRPHRHPLSASRAVVAKPVLNGLHHDYRLAPCST
jgi:putative transposase